MSGRKNEVAVDSSRFTWCMAINLCVLFTCGYGSPGVWQLTCVCCLPVAVVAGAIRVCL